MCVIVFDLYSYEEGLVNSFVDPIVHVHVLYHIDTWYSKIRGKEDIVCLFFFLHATNVYLELKTFNHYY